MITILKSMVLFVLAGLFEIGGGYMVWLSLREGRPWWIGVLGGLWSGGHLSTGKFWPGVCSLWRHFHCDGYYLGLEGGWSCAG